jgi:hypothetical protein
MAWAKHVARMGIRNRIMFVGKPEERKPDINVDGIIILKCSLTK